MVASLKFRSLALVILPFAHGFIHPMSLPQKKCSTPSSSVDRANHHGSHSHPKETLLHSFAGGELTAVDAFFQTSPYVSAFLTCSVKASAADWVAQSMQQEEEERNWNRNLAFIAYGGIYQGCIQSFIFGVLFPMWFPDPTIHSILTQVAIDTLILGPLVCMPTVYTMKAVFAGETDPTAGITKYLDHVQHKGILFKYWSIWGPVQALNFALVPPHLRVYVVAMVSFFWICLLSMVSSSSSSVEEMEEEDRFMTHQHQQADGASSTSTNPSLQLLPIPVLSSGHASYEHAQSMSQESHWRR
ncbi:Mpv17 / PMP22 family [Seminavis robusta]|uniref:Mpv17 / PMP22 family n=1 Tax=Seminavis robusta TaxID=568900 RepID=A0A9N8HQQ8_9STRA|nr:Mpv17 / PMP22 family [Seminavis robusta]|eukprot:Sro1315_g262070.1 Mpv17 / PMP22 family (301) ;mRNA; r:22866-23768